MPPAATMLKHEGVGYADLPRIAHSGNPRDLLSGKGGCDGRLQHQWPYLFEEDGMPYLGFSPRAYGFDFYGDNLYTSKLRLQRIPSA